MFCCGFPLQFTCQVLLIQWEGMLEAGGSGKRLRQGVTSTLQKWCSSNPDGHVVIICKGVTSTIQTWCLYNLTGHVYSLHFVYDL